MPTEDDEPKIIDWYAAFQDPENGFISLLERADNLEKLQACFLIVINQLFTRKTDEDIKEKYLELVEALFANEADEDKVLVLVGIRTKIKMTMAQIMNDRIMKANTSARQNMDDPDMNNPSMDEKRSP